MFSLYDTKDRRFTSKNVTETSNLTSGWLVHLKILWFRKGTEIDVASITQAPRGGSMF